MSMNGTRLRSSRATSRSDERQAAQTDAWLQVHRVAGAGRSRAGEDFRLGYVHVPLKPTKGTRLRIQLTAPAQDGAERPNPNDAAATGNGRSGAGSFGIVEVEIYEDRVIR